MSSNPLTCSANAPAERLPRAAISACGRVLIALLLFLSFGFGAQAQGDDADKQLAMRLSQILQAARSVISNHQELINDISKGDKGLTAAVVLKEALAIYRQNQPDPMAEPADSRAGRLLRAELDAIAEVMDQHQTTINAKGTGFKGFIPAVFGRLVSEAFTRRDAGEASMKVTAPPELVRNRRSRPDAWEEAVIRDEFRSTSWPRGTPYSTTLWVGPNPEFRILWPEYYAASCLSCHGSPKGSVDVTGYPREGAKEHDLGGVISIRLKR